MISFPLQDMTSPIISIFVQLLIVLSKKSFILTSFTILHFKTLRSYSNWFWRLVNWDAMALRVFESEGVFGALFCFRAVIGVG